MLRKIGIALAAGALASTGAVAQDTAKVGLVLPLTGGLAPVGKQVQAGAKLYMDKHGDTVAGKKIELIVKDDAGVPDNSKRLAQELIVNDKVAIIGSALTPSAMAIGPLSTQGKTANVVMVSGTSGVINPNNPYMVRTSFTLGQQSGIIAEWAAKNGSKKVVIVQSDWAPGAEAAAVFTDSFTKAGGQVVETIKVPLANPDFAPFLQRARDLNPDTLFVFVPAGQAGTFAKQFAERGLDKAGIKLIGPGDIVDDNDLPGMGDAMLGVVTAGIYSALHNSPTNKEYVAAFKKANNYPPELHLARRLRRHAPDLRGAQEDPGQDRRRSPGQCDEGHEMGEPARPDLDRSGDPRHRPEHLHRQGREGAGRALQRRVRDLRCRQGSVEDEEVADGRDTDRVPDAVRREPLRRDLARCARDKITAAGSGLASLPVPP